MGNGTRQALADPLALGKAADNKHAERIDEIIARATKAGALGAKAMGASGGGCVLILSRPGMRADVRAAVRPLGDILEFDVDYDGVTIVPSTVPARS